MPFLGANTIDHGWTPIVAMKHTIKEPIFFACIAYHRWRPDPLESAAIIPFLVAVIPKYRGTVVAVAKTVFEPLCRISIRSYFIGIIS
jgi:hypothetical protein